MEPGAIERLTIAPRHAAHLVVELTDPELDAPGEDGWSTRAVLAYLRDAEALAWRLRLERLLAEDNPELAPFEPAAWLSGRATHRDRREELLGDFALQRQASITLLRGMRPADLSRAGTLAGEGPLTVSALIQRWLTHDAEQVARLERLAGATVAEVMERRARPPE